MPTLRELRKSAPNMEDNEIYSLISDMRKGVQNPRTAAKKSAVPKKPQTEEEMLRAAGISDERIKKILETA